VAATATVIGGAHTNPAVHWAFTAACESGANWHINTSNSYSGGHQISPFTGTGFGGQRYASRADLTIPAQRIAVTEKVVAAQDPGPWPVCFRGGASQPALAVPRHTAPPTPAIPVTIASRHAAPETGTGPTRDYTINPGDTLSRMAAANTVSGGGRRVFDANWDVLTNPDLLDVGAHLKIHAPQGTPPVTARVTPTAHTVSTASVAVGLTARVVSAALSEVGTPYVYGGAAPGGFDCSGLVQWIYKQVGISLPRTAAEQATVGRPVSLNQLQPGDLLYYYKPIDHVVIYLGKGKIAEASQPGTPVHVRALYLDGFVQARRIV